ncbi:hypothetical protein QEN19_003258 [Hanseniaspora menglaensis]
MIYSLQKIFLQILLLGAHVLHVASSNIKSTEDSSKNDNSTRTIFDFIEKELFHHSINNLSYYNTDIIDSLFIDFKNPKDDNVEYDPDGFNLGNSTNVYWFYKYPSREPGFSHDFLPFDNLKLNETKQAQKFDSCKGTTAHCSFERARYLLNKIDSDNNDKKHALELLHRSEKEVPESLFLLGTLYENYEIIFSDEEGGTTKFDSDLKSILYFEQCSQLGDINCQLAIAHKHYMGELLPKDYTKAATIYFSVINRVINDFENTHRYPWTLSNHETNIWNHNFFKFVNDPELKKFEYVDLNMDSNGILKDSSIVLNTKNNLPLSDGIGDLELVKVMHFLHESRKLTLKNPDSSLLEQLNKVKLYNPTFENLKTLYLQDEFLLLEDDVLLYIYTDIMNTIKGNMFSNDTDLQYAFSLLKKILQLYKKMQSLIDSKLSPLGKYYLGELIIIFTNIYKEHGVFNDDEINANLIISLYKTAHELSSLADETHWEVFKYLHFMVPQSNFENIFQDYIVENKNGGYSFYAALNYHNKCKINKLLRENLNADSLIMEDNTLQNYIHIGMAQKYLPALIQNCNLKFQLLPGSQPAEKVSLIQQLRTVLEAIRIEENMPIFHQNFINIMNYKNGHSSSLNLFAMLQLSSMGFEKAINNLANELIQPVKFLSSTDPSEKTTSSSLINAGISKYLTSYKLGNLNHGLQLSSILDNLKHWSKMLSLNHLIADTNGNFYSFYNLGRIYEEGKGVPQDFEKASEYFNKALTYDALSSYYDMSMTSNGLEISLQLLLLRLKLKKWFYRVNFFKKIGEYINDVFATLFTNLSILDITSDNSITKFLMKLKYNVLSMLSALGIDPLLMLSIAVIILFATLPKILRYLARRYGWNITINGDIYVNGHEFGSDGLDLNVEQDSENNNEALLEIQVEDLEDFENRATHMNDFLAGVLDEE